MMKKTILLSAFAASFAIASYAQTENKTAAPAPATAAPAVENKNQADFKFEEMEFSYGSIKQGDKVEHDFMFTNTGKEPLIITDARGSCGCTVPEWPKEPIKKGEKGKIHVTFNSAGKMGMQDKTVTITSNAKSNPLVLHLKGTVEAAPVAPETKPAEAPKN
jgi:hypothetical protein